MDEAHEARINACKEVIDSVNKMDFVSLTGEEAQKLITIRAVAKSVIDGKTTPTSNDVNSILHDNINCRVSSCKKVMKLISKLNYDDLDNMQREGIKKILKLARQVFSIECGIWAMNEYKKTDRLMQWLEGKIDEQSIREEMEALDMEDKKPQAGHEIQDFYSQYNEGMCGNEEKRKLVRGEKRKRGNGETRGHGNEMIEIGNGETREHENEVRESENGETMEHENDARESGSGETVENENESMESENGEMEEPGEGATSWPVNAVVTRDRVTHYMTNVKWCISWPANGIITQDWVTQLMATFKWSSWNKPPWEFPSIMPFHVVEELIRKASHIIYQEPNCVKIQCDKDSEVVVVGDLRGHYHDLLKIWENVGLPSENKFFVFTGNYVGGGFWGLELFLVLLAWKVLMPQRVYLLRGNHESKGNSKKDAFPKELYCKFAKNGKAVYDKCVQAFARLPLASVIADCVYTTHGGLFHMKKIVNVENLEGKQTKKSRKWKTGISKGKKKQKITTIMSVGCLEELSGVNRFIEVPSAKNDPILTDVLWSDPSMEPGFKKNDTRDAGLLWGPDCTETFLKQSKLKVIIRSHESPDSRTGREGLNKLLEGYSIDHEVESGKLCTLFSASQFCPDEESKNTDGASEESKNMGAYAVLKPPDFDKPEFISFMAEERPEVRLN